MEELRQQRLQAARRQDRRNSRLASHRPTFVFFHLGKTGGGSVRQLLGPIRSQWVSVGHRGTLDEIQQQWPDLPMVFFVRDPLTRFVSGFNNFRRAVVHKSTGKLPSDHQLVAYSLFATANDLAEGLVSHDEHTRSSAHWAIGRLGFLSNHLTANLGSPAIVDQHRPQIALIGLFERFDISIEAMRVALHLPASLQLPAEPSLAHRGLSHLPNQLSPMGRAAVTQWYRADIALYEHCRHIHLVQTQELLGA